MEEKKGLVFNIQRYSLNDGNGIRTISIFQRMSFKVSVVLKP